MQTKFIRSESNKMIGGVCAGLAAYLDVDPILVRFAFIMLIFASGIGLPLYLVLWVLMPNEEDGLAPNHPPEWYEQDEIVITDEDIESVKDENRAVRGESHPHGPTIFAVILIIIGLFLLAQNFGLLGWFIPILTISIGLFAFYRSQNKTPTP